MTLQASAASPNVQTPSVRRQHRSQGRNGTHIEKEIGAKQDTHLAEHAHTTVLHGASPVNDDLGRCGRWNLYILSWQRGRLLLGLVWLLLLRRLEFNRRVWVRRARELEDAKKDVQRDKERGDTEGCSGDGTNESLVAYSLAA